MYNDKVGVASGFGMAGTPGYPFNQEVCVACVCMS